MIPIPTPRLLIFFSLPLLVLIPGIWYAPLLSAAIYLNLGLLILSLFDILSSIKRPQPLLSPPATKLYSIGQPDILNLEVENPGNSLLELKIRLLFPESFQGVSSTQKYSLAPKEKTTSQFDFTPLRRGAFPLKQVYIRTQSILGLFTLQSTQSLPLLLEVLPDIKTLNFFLKLTRKNRIADLGIHKTRLAGMGTELESLREYQRDDDSRLIDWKASTRLGRPVSKVFQMERNNHIQLVLDTGRMMGGEQKGLSTMDHAINSLLLLSHVAFDMGDNLSILAFSDHIKGELPNLKGKSSLKKITRFLSALEPEYVESNYQMVLEYLYKKQNRRSLIIFITDMLDDINYSLFKKGFSQLSRKHQVLFILMRDTTLQQTAQTSITRESALYESAAAREMLLRRQEAIHKLRLNKINLLDTLPDKLSGKLINQYLELKAKNRI